MVKKKKKGLFSRLIKWCLIVLLLLVIGAVAVPYVFRDQIIDMARTEANANLNARVDWDSFDVSLISTFPDFGLEINGFQIDGIDNFAGVQLVAIEKLSLSLDLWKTISGEEFEIHSVGLLRPKINVLVLHDGTANYDIAKASGDSIHNEEVDSTQAAPLKLVVSEYFIREADIIYDDHPGGIYAELKNFSHEGAGDFAEEIFDLKTKTTADGITYRMDGVTYARKVKTDITCNVNMNMLENRYTFDDDNDFNFNALGLQFYGWLQLLEDGMDMDVNFNTKKTTFSSILSMVPGAYVPDFGDVKTDGKFDLKGAAKGKLKGDILPQFDLALAIENAYFQYPDLPAKVEHINVLAKVSHPEGSDMDRMLVDVPKLQLDFLENKIDVNTRVEQPLSDPNIASHLNAYLDLAELSKAFPLGEGVDYNGIITTNITLEGRMSSIEQERYDEFKALGSLIVDSMKYHSGDLAYDVMLDRMEFNFTPSNLELASLDAMIGTSDLQANGTIDNYMGYVLKDELLHGTFNLTSNKFDLNELMASPEGASPEVTGDTEKSSESEQPAMDSASGVVRVPENVDFTLNTTFKRLVYDSILIDNLSGKILAKEGVASLKNLRMDVFDGSVTLNGMYATHHKEAPEMNLTYDVSNLDIGKTAHYVNSVEKLAPIAKSCRGAFSTTLSMKGQLDQNMEPVYNSLTGKGDLFVQNVYVEKFEPLNKLAQTLKIDRLSKQNFKDVKLFYEFKDGNVHVKPFDIKMGKMDVNIGGKTAFTQEIDYDLKMQVPSSELGGLLEKGAAALDKLASANGLNLSAGDKIPEVIKVNAKLGGTVTEPKIVTDFVRSEGKSVVGSVVEAGIDKAKEELSKQADDLLAKAREEADRILATGKKEAERIRSEGKKQADALRAKQREEAEKIRKKAYDAADAEVEKISNPLKKIAAREAAKLAKKAADKKFTQAEDATDKQANKLEDVANRTANETEELAKKQADKVLAAAQKESDQRLKN